MMQNSQITVSSSGKVFLTLPGKEYKSRRYLGTIIQDVFHCERLPERHFFRQFGGSYGFNYELMRDGSFKSVVVHLPLGETLTTSRQHILKRGKFLAFQRNQLERQLFIPVDEFGKTEEQIEPEPHHPIHPPIQPSLFCEMGAS